MIARRRQAFIAEVIRDLARLKAPLAQRVSGRGDSGWIPS